MFAVPKSRADLPENRFEFTFPGSRKKYSIPLLKFIRPTLAADIQLMGDVEATRHIINAYFPDEDLLAKFDDQDQFDAWIEAWRAESGIGLGESEASSDS